ncbi:hypothetical protein AAFF_G00013740 [Aldrovandia affinis]|uniref:Endonuclease/exonuclease/phosphatase domain-containing protein n=1 Tax=Aldrovandia affinis TaxID=143900 RepID=A0AAD7S699_9TELE|nr:hypothetical protein AAFF_G00013740 [Aldrovandia affinis]
MKIATLPIPARSSPGSPRTAPTVGHQDGGVKCTTGKLRTRENIVVGTWNVRTLTADGKLEELAHEMDQYHWNILGISELRWKSFGETSTDKGHKLYFSGKENKHEHGVGFLVHKDILGTVMGCQPVSSRLITIRLRATPFNITIIQAYAPTSTYQDSEVEDFYEQLQAVLDQTPKKDIIIMQGDWNAKVGEDAYPNWKDTCGPYSNIKTNDRGLRLLEFARYNNLMLANTLDLHKASRRWTWHSPNGEHHNQIDYILIKKRFQSSVNIGRTRSFPKADIGSDHDLVLMSFRLRLKKIKSSKYTRMKLNLDKLQDPEVAELFKTTLGGKITTLLLEGAEDTDTDTMTTKFNTAVTETATAILGKLRPKRILGSQKRTARSM